MSPRGRVFSLVALAAVVASGVVVLGVVLTRSDVAAAPKPRGGRPPLTLDLGVRTDAEARALARAEVLYGHGQARRAAAVFRRYDSLEARVASAMAAWPGGTVERLDRLAKEHARSALVRLHFGLALYWARRDEQAVAEWRTASREQPDTPYAVQAQSLLHPEFASGLPRFVPSFETPLRIRVLPVPRQFAALARAAKGGGAHPKIVYGTALQQLGRPVSAEREFAAAARLAPDDPDARTAAAVGLFDKADPSRAFGRLGPLVRVFPQAQTVRFHLGLLLLWSARVEAARRQLTLARKADRQSVLGRQATQYLRALGRVGTR